MLTATRFPNFTAFHRICTANLRAEPAWYAVAAIAQRVDERKKLVEHRIFPDGFRHGPRKGFESDTSDVPFGVGPDRWQVAAVDDLSVERRSSIRRRDAASRLSSSCRECVLHAMEQELFDGAQERSTALRIGQT